MVRRYVVLDFSPIIPLFTIGSALLLMGSCWGGFHWWQSIETGKIASTGTVMLAVLPNVRGTADAPAGARVGH